MRQQPSYKFVNRSQDSEDGWSLREAVETLREPIADALKKGYTYAEISQMLTAQGITIRPSTLKAYLSSAKHQSFNQAGNPYPQTDAQSPQVNDARQRYEVDAVTGRDALLMQAGALADDETLEALQAHIDYLRQHQFA